MRKKIEKIILIVFVILFITLTPITTYINIDTKSYATDITTSNELIKQTMIGLLISAGLVFNTAQSAEDTYQRLDDYLKSLGPGFELGPNPNDPQGPKIKLGDVLFNMALGQVIYDNADGVYKKVVKISDDFFDLIKGWIDSNFNVGENIIGDAIDSYIIGEHVFLFSVVEIPQNPYSLYEYKLNYKGIDYNLTGPIAQVFYNAKLSNLILNGNKLEWTTISNYINASGQERVNIVHTGTIYIDINSSNPQNLVPNQLKVLGVENIVDNPNYNWTNTTTKQRDIVIPIAPNEVGLPKKDETGIYVPSIDTEDWIGVTPAEIPNMDPKGEPFLEPGQLPEVPANPQTIPEKILYFVAEAFKKISGIKENTDISNPTIMGLPSADGTGNGGTGTPTKFEWGDFKNFFDIFFIFIYFIVMLILILLKLLQVVFSGLPNIPANTDLFDNYPTILDGVNYIKNLKVGGLSITVQQAFEYVFLIFFFIFVLKQIRKLYGAYVYEENERTRADSGLSDTNFERKQNDYFSDARKNPNRYSNIKVHDLRGKKK